MATCAWHYILPRATKVLGERSMVCCVGVGVAKCRVSEWMFVMAAPMRPAGPPHTAFAEVVAAVGRTCPRSIDSRKKKSAEEVWSCQKKVVFLSTLSKWSNHICKSVTEVT